MKTVSNVAQELLENVRFKYIDFESWCDRDEDIRVARDVIVSCESSNSVDRLNQVYRGSTYYFDKNIVSLSKDSVRYHSNSDYDNWTRSLIYQDLLRILRALVIQKSICDLGDDRISFEDHGCCGMYIFINIEDGRPLHDAPIRHVIEIDGNLLNSSAKVSVTLITLGYDLRHSKGIFRRCH